MSQSTLPARRLPVFSRSASFLVSIAVLSVFLFAASAPSPLYPVYQQLWQFSSITLTVVFAVYAIALLLALVTVGALSDFVGRKPVVLASLVIEAASMVLFYFAGGVPELMVARVLQGLATGLGMGALSALLIDLAPVKKPYLGPLVSSVAPTIGLAAGAVGSGALVQWGPRPTELVFGVMLAALVVLVVASFFLPEPVTRQGGALASLKPSVAIPLAARRTFLSAAPAIAATWGTGGLYLSLGSSLMAGVLGVTNHFESGLVVATLFAFAGVASYASRNVAPVTVMRIGAATLATGTVVSLVGITVPSVAAFFVGTALAGLGFGSSFSGAFRTLAPLAAPHERAELFSAVYTVSYVAFSVPAVLAGIAVSHYGLHDSAVVYGLVVIAAALTAALSGLRTNDTATATNAA